MTALAGQPGFSLASQTAMQGYVAQCIMAATDPALIVSAVAGLVPPPGYTYGRYGNGALGQTLTGNTTVAQALASTTTARTAVEAAGAVALMAAEASLQPGFVAAVTALAEAVRATSADPASAIRLLSMLAVYTAPAAVGLPGLFVTLVCRRAALLSLARATASYSPVSYEDGAMVLAAVVMLFDAEIQVAADLFDAGSYMAMRAVRTAIVNDLTTRSATLPDLITISTPVSIPALTLAYSLYGDASRSDDLVTEANPVCPLFMPTQFTALSA